MKVIVNKIAIGKKNPRLILLKWELVPLITKTRLMLHQMISTLSRQFSASKSTSTKTWQDLLLQKNIDGQVLVTQNHENFLQLNDKNAQRERKDSQT